MAMKKFINDPDNLVSELLEGYALAYANKVKLAGDGLVVRAKQKDAGKVGIVTIGGSGHEPALSGFVGEGLLDISVPGEIFAAPGPPQCLKAIKMADRGAGVLFVVLNHEGDVLSANMTMEMVEKEGLNVRMLLTQEDIANAPRSEPENRRGFIGFLPVYKIAGAAAEAGKSLEDVYQVASRYATNMATLAVAVKTGTVPVTGDDMFSLPDEDMEIGLGQHGEAGTGQMELKTADETADIMMDMLLRDLDVKAGEKILGICNGLGGTTLMEQFIVYRRMHQICGEKGIELARGTVGEYITVQEMAGIQMHIGRLDDELIELWDAPCSSPFFSM